MRLPYDVTLEEFQQRNAKRCREAFDENLHTLEFFMIAIAGETGEMCNIYKKVIRGDFPLEDCREKLLSELADIIMYCDLTITKLGAHTDSVLIKKFNEVSERRNWKG